MILFLLLPLGFVIAGAAYQSIQTARDRRRYPPPGRLIEVNGQKLHIHEQGMSGPTVVLEAGIGASSLSWSTVQPQLAEFARVISYDRAGLGWSGSIRRPRTVAGMIEELRSALITADVQPPYILVGHSFGGLLMRVFAAWHSGEVRGLVLVDPVGISTWANCSDAQLRRISLGVRLAKRGAWLARLGVVRLALETLVAGRTWFPKLAAKTGGKKGTAAMAHLIAEVRKLEPEVLPVVRSQWSDPKSFSGLSHYVGCLPESARYALDLHLTDIPVVVLSASTATPQELAERDLWTSFHPRSQHIRVANSGHWLHLEQPEIVVAAVQMLV